MNRIGSYVKKKASIPRGLIDEEDGVGPGAMDDLGKELSQFQTKRRKKKKVGEWKRVIANPVSSIM